MAVRTGIFGSAFNPPHNAHFSLAQTARKTFKLKKLIYVPAGCSPHKEISGDWDDITRSFMVHIASFSDTPVEVAQKLRILPYIKKDTSEFIRNYTDGYENNHDPDVSVSDIEIESPEVSYTIDTVKTLLDTDPDRELFLIIGMDQAAIFDTWKNWDELSRLARICAGNRPGSDEKFVREHYPFIEIFSIPPSEVSSTFIREKIAKKESISGFVPKIIEDFLRLL